MRVSFQHVGNMWVGLKAVADKIGFDMVVPPITSQHTLSLGARYSPEMVCLPFKLTLGNMIESLELGADTLITIGQYGPCRFGYYHRLQEVILRDLGYEFELLKQSNGMLRMIKYFTNGASIREIFSAFSFGLNKLKALDEVERLVHRIRAIEQKKGSASRIFRDATEAVDNARDYRAIKQAKQVYLQKLQNLPTISSANPIKIGVVGEFFVVVDPFANMDVEIELGKLGVQVERPQSVLEWLDFNPFTLLLGLREKERSFKAARPYLSRNIGGDGLQTVGEKVLHANEWDGLVHIEPFGCLPEIMARNIMPATAEQLPVLNLIFDEHTGRAGVINRLEAFVDMIKRRKKKSLELRV
jgi:predicted nucleotide-binding protein (sugar kinase/HSP70/actin superfamily)